MVTCSLSTKSIMDKVKESLRHIERADVLVGIPAEKSSRGNGDDTVTNAELLFIHTHGVRNRSMRKEMQASMNSGKTYSAAHQLYIKSHGSPALDVPPRPVLEPAIEANKDAIGRYLQRASKEALSGNREAQIEALNAAGQKAASCARNWFEDPRNNWPPNSPKTIARKGSALPLVDTGEMRKAITYVVRNK